MSSPSAFARFRARVHLPALSVLLPYLVAAADTVREHPEWVASLAGKLGVSAAVAVPIVLAFLKPLAKTTSAPPDAPREGG